MKQIGLLIVCILVSCSSGSETEAGAQEAELHCGEWCNRVTGCDTLFGDVPNCSAFCRSELAQPCGEHVAAYQNCVMALDCADRPSECEVHVEALTACREALEAACASCPEGTACYNDGCGEACALTGECDYTATDGSCRHQFESGYCSDYEGCVENGGDCPPEALP